MIEVKLAFASYEEAISALAAVRQAIGKEAAAPKAETSEKQQAKPEKATKPAAKPETAAPEKKDAEGSAPTAAAGPTGASQTPATESKSPGISSDVLGAKIKEAVAVNRAVVVETLAKYGAKAGKDLKAEQYADVLADLEKALTPAEDLT